MEDLFFDMDYDYDLGDGISSDMEVDEVCACGLDMSLIWEFHIVLIEVDMPLLFHTRDDIIFIDSSEYFSIFPLESIFECLSVEEFLYLIAFFEFFSGLVFSSFFPGLELSQSLGCHFLRESLRDEHIPSLGARDRDDISLPSEVRDIDEEFYGESGGRHRSIL